jgi:hypothetical protein
MEFRYGKRLVCDRNGNCTSEKVIHVVVEPQALAAVVELAKIGLAAFLTLASVKHQPRRRF